MCGVIYLRDKRSGTVLKQLPLELGKMRNWMRPTFRPKTICLVLRPVLVVLWTIRAAALTISAAAIPII